MLIRLIPVVLFFLAADDSMQLPSDYREWVYVSSGVGMNYSPAGTPAPSHPPFQNVFVNRPAYQQFLKTGSWPDQTTFVLEIRRSESEGSINKGGLYQGNIAAVEAEVKQNGQWSFYAFGSGKIGRLLARTENCYSCHAQNAAVDNTFVQFYPTLLPIAKEKGTYKEPPPPPKAALQFEPKVIASDLKGGYQVIAADMNHDGKPDLIALGSTMTDLVWYENPGWQRHTIISNLPHMINCAAEDTDGDGIPELAIAWEFANDAAKSIGKVGILRHDGDPGQPWKLTQIDQTATSHRLRWADIDSSGHKVLVNAALTGFHAAPPDYAGDHAPILFYRPGAWKRETASEANEGVQHGISVVKWNAGDTSDSLLTASFSGIGLLQYRNGKWSRSELSKGDPSACPKCGSSDVSLGYSAGKKFMAAIEPWHGNQVAIYNGSGSQWKRTLIDDTLTDGHTIVTADLDNDGSDEVIAGFRGGTKAVFVYKTNPAGGWDKQILDATGAGAAACVAADFDSDHATDIACIGASTLKLFRNVSAQQSQSAARR